MTGPRCLFLLLEQLWLTIHFISLPLLAFFPLCVTWVLGLQHSLIKIVMIPKLFPLYKVGGFITSLVGTILAEISVYIWL